MAENSSQTKKSHLTSTIWISIAAAFLILVANSAFWFNKYIFDKTNFTQITTAAIQLESSRQAVAVELTNRLFANRPVLARVAEEPAQKIISGALASNAAQKVFTRAIDALHSIATSANPQDITLDLTTFKQLATNLAKVFEDQTGQTSEAEVRIEDIPDTITIVDADNVPHIYTMGVVLLWVGPLAALGALALLIYLLYRLRRTLNGLALVLVIEASAIALFGVVALLVGPLFKPVLLANVQSANMQVVVGNIYQAFINTFNTQSSWLFFGTALALAFVAIILWAAPPAYRWVQRRRHP